MYYKTGSDSVRPYWCKYLTGVEAIVSDDTYQMFPLIFSDCVGGSGG